MNTNDKVTSYSIYNKKQKKKTKINPLENIYPKLPDEKYDIIYADPPWNYGGKMQYDKSSIQEENKDFKRDIFISSAEFIYPTLTISQLKELDIPKITSNDCLLFMWTTGPQFANSIELGKHWGFEYKTVGFVWDKMIHNPGHYTLSQTEFVLIFKHGRIPQPRGAKNVRQFIQVPRGKHSEKPEEVIECITRMFPKQKKIELFARKNYKSWSNWGLEIPESQINIPTREELEMKKSQVSLFD